MAAAADLPLGSPCAGRSPSDLPLSDPIPPLDQGVDGADGESGGNAGSAAPPLSKEKKVAWNVSSAAGEAAAGIVMDTLSWPALSDSARASPNSSSSESLGNLSESWASAPPAPVVASSPARAIISDNPNLNNVPNPASPSRVKASKQRGFSNGGREPSPKESPNKNHNQSRDYGTNDLGFSQYSHGDHLGHSGNRRVSNSGGGSYQGSPGGRREHERGGYEWNPWRGFAPRDTIMQPMPPPQRGLPRPHLRQPPPPPIPTMQFVHPPLVPPYMNHMVITDVPSPVFIHPPPFPEAIRNMPMLAPVVPPPLFYPQVDLRAMLLKQIEYYFSTDNLCKDTYLRQKMDDQGWVRLSLIAGFEKVKQLTNDVHYILDTISNSNVVEVQPGAGFQIQDYRIRRRGDWRNWVLPSNNNNVAAHHQQGIAAAAWHPVRNLDSLPVSFQALDLGDGNNSSTSAAGN